MIRGTVHAAPRGGRETEAIAARVLQAMDGAASTPPITEADPAFGLARAYAAAARVTELRVARGERIVGWKIGFTNRSIWDEYGVFAPIWGPMYDTTVTAVEAPAVAAQCPLARFAEPRIEPEIAFRLARIPTADMAEADLLGCIDAVAHGFEIVQSVFPGWRFAAADTVVAGALHGCYLHGPWATVERSDRARWLTMLGGFAIALARDGVVVDRGTAANVLDGPLSALRHFVAGLAAAPLGRGLAPGDIVTTGTVTRAFPVLPGERWSSEVEGLPVGGLTMALT